MNRRRDLVVFGEPEALESLIGRIESQLSDGWSRDPVRAAQLQRVSGNRERLFWFVCPASAEHAEAALVMALEDRRLSIANIFTCEEEQLTLEQYNAILAEFDLKFLAQEAAEADLTVELTADERTIEQALGPEGMMLLRRFSTCANKSSRHPFDDRRWLEFLIYYFRRPRDHFDLSLVSTWLREDGWSSNKESELMYDCEVVRNALGLLARKELLNLDGQMIYRHLAE